MLRGHQLSGTRRLNGHYQNGAIKERWGWIVKSEFNTNLVNAPGSVPDHTLILREDTIIKNSPWNNLNDGIWIKFKIEFPTGYGLLVDARQLYTAGSGYPSFLEDKTIYYPSSRYGFGPGPYGYPLAGTLSFVYTPGGGGQEWGFSRALVSSPVVLKKSTLTPYNFSTYNRYLTNNVVEFYAYIPYNFYQTVQNNLISLKIQEVDIIGSPYGTSEWLDATIYIRYATEAEVQREGMIV